MTSRESEQEMLGVWVLLEDLDGPRLDLLSPDALVVRVTDRAEVPAAVLEPGGVTPAPFPLPDLDIRPGDRVEAAPPQLVGGLLLAGIPEPANDPPPDLHRGFPGGGGANIVPCVIKAAFQAAPGEVGRPGRPPLFSRSPGGRVGVKMGYRVRSFRIPSRPWWRGRGRLARQRERPTESYQPSRETRGLFFCPGHQRRALTR